jgi:1-acyl-sn-glycerol-3-phosphate acyltransferase
MLNKIYTVLFVPFFLVTAPLLVLTSALIFVVALPFDHQRKLQHLFSAFISWFYFSASPFVTVVVKGREHVDRGGTYVVTSNHQSMLDILLLYNVPLYFRWVSKHEVYRIPLVGQLLRLHGDVCIRRGDASSIRKMMRDCTAILQRGISIMMFPEGTRSKDGKVARFRSGAFALAKENHVPVLPVAIDGTRAFANGNGGWFNARQLFQVTIFPPIPADEVAATGERELIEKVQALVVEEHKRMTSSVYK